jgi:hypothetical protein
MSAVTNWFRPALAYLAVAALPLSAAAARATPVSKADPAEIAPAGSPEFGILIIIGAVAFLAFVAWLFTRVGDDSGPRGDGSMI